MATEHTLTPTSTLTMDRNRLGPILTRARRLHGVSQRRLADQLCAASGMPTVSRHEVSRWERGERIPSAFWLGWLADVLGVPVDDLEQASSRAPDRPIIVGRPAAGVVSLQPVQREITGWPWRLIRANAVVNSAGGVTLQVA